MSHEKPKGRQSPYTPAENATLASVYPTGGLDACTQALPHRSLFSIKHRVGRLGLRLESEELSQSRRRGGVVARERQLAAPIEVVDTTQTPAFRFAPSVFSLGAAMQGGVQPVRLSGPPGRVHQSDDEPLELETGCA